MTNYQTIPLLREDTLHGGTCSIRVVTNQTKYSRYFNITNEDTIGGIAIHYSGYRWGGAMSVQLQQSMNGNGSLWYDTGTAHDLGTGGANEATPATLDEVHWYPAPSGNFYLPALRLKITTAVGATGVVLEELFRTVRGLK